MFSQTSILNLNPPVAHGSQLLVSWTTTAAAGTLFQVYLEGALMYAGVATSCAIPMPLSVGRIDVGTVAPGERQVNFSSSLPPRPPRHATLSWQGGTYLGSDLVAFNVYGESSAGAGINYTKALASVPAYTPGVVTDGYGNGGYGQGGYGLASGSYSWTSPPLAGGVWNWGVCPVDSAGNVGPPQTTSVALSAPPAPPAPLAFNSRLEYQYNPTTRQATLTWNPSPA